MEGSGVEKKLLIEVSAELRALAETLKTVKSENDKTIEALKAENEALKDKLERAEYRIVHLSKNLRACLDAEK